MLDHRKFQIGTSKMNQEGFTRIGQTGQTAVGESLRAVGNSAGRQGAVQSREDTNRVAAWLSRQVPADADKAAVSRALSHGVGLRVKYEYRYPSGPNGESMPSYAVAVSCDMTNSGNHEAALFDLRNFMTPAPIRQIEGWLAELSVIVARKADDQFADELRVSVYSSRLSRFPADVVRSVLLKTTYRFWPTWEELEKRCSALTGPRAQMIAALERGPHPVEEMRRAQTEEERARIQALVDRMFPSQSSDERKAAAELVLKANAVGEKP